MSERIPLERKATSPREHNQGAEKSFEPKTKVELQPPSDEPISYDDLAQCDGTNPDKPTLVAIKGTVFDVSKNEAYGPKGNYHVFAGKDPSRALAQSSLKPEDCRPDWYDLPDQAKTVLNEWFTFFSKRYNVVGKIQGAANT